MAAISVIVPIYKVEAFLHRCVDSILAQTFADFDLVLVDDGSPDSCGDICEEYARKDGRIHVIHQKNGGLSAARNTGIDWAQANSGSQWLAFVDSDDWVHPDFLLRLYTMVQETGCLLSACGYFRTGGGDFPAMSAPEYRVLSADDYYCPDEAGEDVPAIAWNKLYHKSLFDTLRYPVGKLHEDEFTTYLAVYRAGKVAVTREPLYAYYQNPVGIMLSKWTPRKAAHSGSDGKPDRFRTGKRQPETAEKGGQAVYLQYIRTDRLCKAMGQSGQGAAPENPAEKTPGGPAAGEGI